MGECLSEIRKVADMPQFSSCWYLTAWESPCALRPVSPNFHKRLRLKQIQYVGMNDNGSLVLSSFVYAPLLKAIDSVMPLTLWPQEMSQAPQHFRPSEMQSTCGSCFK